VSRMRRVGRLQSKHRDLCALRYIVVSNIAHSQQQSRACIYAGWHASCLDFKDLASLINLRGHMYTLSRIPPIWKRWPSLHWEAILSLPLAMCCLLLRFSMFVFMPVFVSPILSGCHVISLLFSDSHVQLVDCRPSWLESKMWS
jgi:hypothetical protein